MALIPFIGFSSSYRPYVLEAQKITQWPVACKGSLVVSINNSGRWSHAPSKRGWGYSRGATQPVKPLVRTKTSSRVNERRFAGYGTVIYLKDLIDARTINAWLKEMSASPLTTNGNNVVSSVFIEGINFNLDNADVVARARELFVDLTATAHDMMGGDAATLVNGNDHDYPYSQLTAYESDMFDGERYSILNKDGNGKTFTNGYIRVGSIVVTNLPSMAALARTLLHHDAMVQAADQPVDKEAKFRAAWLERLLSDIRKRETSANAKVEKLAAQLREASRELGEARLLLKVAENNTDVVLAESLAKIKNIPETESVTISDSVFTVITAPMNGVLARTGEERYCGKFEIQISLNGAVRVRNVASPHALYRNPHGECTGTYNGVFSNALAAFDYYALVLSIMEYYRTFDPRHEKRWSDLPNTTCVPKKVYESDWHSLVGQWTTAAVHGVAPNKVKSGDAVRQYVFAPVDVSSPTTTNVASFSQAKRKVVGRRR